MNELFHKLSALSPEKRAMLEKHIKHKLEENKDAIVSRDWKDGVAPASFSQRRLWFLSEMEPDNPAYTIPFAFHVIGELDIGLLRSALERVAIRHEPLRTRFEVNEEGELLQRIQDNPEVCLTHIDLRHLSASEKLSERKRLTQAEVQAPCNHRSGLLWRVTVIRAGDEEHFLLFVMHHLIFDGWSVTILLEELTEMYRALHRGEQPLLFPPALKYADYAAWQTGRLSESVRERQLNYWKEQLEGDLQVLQLPNDMPRPKRQTFNGSAYMIDVPKQLSERLKSLAKTEDSTMFRMMLAAFQTLLYRYTGQPDIVVGFPISGRVRNELESLIGVFVNTLPLRVDLSNNPRFPELLKQVKRLALEAYEHQDVPFDMIVEAVEPRRDPSCHPIFQVLFTYQKSIKNYRVPGAVISFHPVDGGTSKFDLSLDILEGDDVYPPTCIFEYNTDLFKRGTVERMARHYIGLLEHIVRDPDCPVGELPFMNGAELAALLPPDHSTVLADPQRETVVSLFEEQALRHKELIAVKSGGSSLSYGELNKQANKFARYLIDHGASRGDHIGICMEKSCEMVIAIVAALKAGAVYVPIDPEIPEHRLHHVLRDAGLSHVVTVGGLKQMFADTTGMAICYDECAEQVASRSGDNVALALEWRELAYIIYTSGSTGLPKGTMVSHGNIVNTYKSWEKVYELGANIRHLQMANISFDVCTGDIVRALCSGGCLVLCPQRDLLDAEKLYGLIQDERIEFAEFVPAVVRSLMDYLQDTGHTLSGFRTIVVGSDMWHMSEYTALRALAGSQTRVVNSYGLTEATVDSLYFESAEPQAVPVKQVPLGYAMPHARVYILDTNLQLVPPGVPGELYIGGSGVAVGYLNQPEWTAQRFIDDPFMRGGRLYKTGDICKYIENNCIQMLGRADFQMKIRGHRIEPEEIEHVIHQRFAVKACTVQCRQDDDGKQTLTAYLVPQDAAELIDGVLLRDALKPHLPEYMIPSAVVVLPELPLLANGKLDRNALPKPARASADRFYVAPRTLTEAMLEDIWSQVFQRPRIGVFDDFFRLGGHSLLAMQIAGKVRQMLNVKLPLHMMFEAPTIAGLAAAIVELQGERATADEAARALPPFISEPDRRYEPFPLTDVQQAYWIGRNEAFEFGNVSTHSYDEFEAEHLDIERFEYAWNRLIGRHDMLRAIVRPDGMQQILPRVPDYRIAVTDLRHCDDEERRVALAAVRDSMSHEMLDTGTWPVFQVRITRLDEQTSRIHFSSDALLWDAWSFVILMEELITIYHGREQELKPIDITFRDYVISEQEMKHTERYQSALAYWKNRIQQLPPAPELPMYKHPRAIKEPKFTRYHKMLDENAWRRLKNTAMRHGITATGFFLAAYAETLAVYSGHSRFSLNLTFLNRLPFHPHVNDIVGEFTSLTVLSVDHNASLSFIERARTIQQHLWHDLEHNDISGVQVLRELTKLQGGALEAKLPVVFTSALVVPIPGQNDSGFVMKASEGITQTSQVWLDCGVWEADNQLLCNWDVVEELYPPGFLRDMLDAYWGLVERMASEGELWSASELSLLPPYQMQMRQSLNAVRRPASSECLHTLFGKQARLHPERPAVLTLSRVWSYRDIDGMSNRLARFIAGQHPPGRALVAVALEKGWEQIVAVLAIVKAGLAYMPVDPELPDGRIVQLLEQGGVSLIVTSAGLRRRMECAASAYVIAMEDIDWDGCELEPAHERGEQSDTAYVIFTSGSTGVPKGVEIDHKGAVNTILAVNALFNVTPEDRILALSSLSFDLSVYDIFGALAAGAAIVVPEHDRRLDPEHWTELMQQRHVTVWNSAPALMKLMTELHARRKAPPLSALRLAMLSGDWVPLDLPEAVKAMGDGIEVYSLGGATEASIWSIHYKVDQLPEDWKSIPYGKPLPNQRVYVLNEWLELCPDWVTGELYIAGDGLARGYWRDEARTAQSFVTHPKTGERLYRTGDMGRYRPDGNIEFIGRRDSQIKMKGYRIELGEIESALRQLPGVKDCAVCPVQVDDASLLAAFIVVDEATNEDGESWAAGKAKAYLAGKLPHYMVPSVYQTIERIPLTANGKLDKKALRLERSELISAGTAFEGPQTETERTVLAIWQQTLDAASISINTDFFEAGGDSMAAIRTAAAIREHYRIPFPLRVVFEHVDIKSLASYIDAMTMQGVKGE